GSGTGAISIMGTLTSAGTVNFTVTPSDAIGSAAGTTYTLTVNPMVVLSPGTLPAGEVGLAYSSAITSSGGAGSVVLNLSNIANTSGLTISGSGTGTIAISGTP